MSSPHYREAVLEMAQDIRDLHHGYGVNVEQVLRDLEFCTQG